MLAHLALSLLTAAPLSYSVPAIAQERSDVAHGPASPGEPSSDSFVDGLSAALAVVCMEAAALADDPKVAFALEHHRIADLTRFANGAVRAGEGIDVVAFFGRGGALVAINDRCSEGGHLQVEGLIRTAGEPSTAGELARVISPESLNGQLAAALYGPCGPTFAATAAVIGSKGESLGWVSTRTRVRPLLELEAERSPAPFAGSAWLVDRSGRILGGIDAADSSREPTAPEALPRVARTLLESAAEDATFRLDGRDFRLAQLPDPTGLTRGLRVLIESPGEDTMKGAAAASGGLVLALVGSSVVAFGLAAWLLRQRRENIVLVERLGAHERASKAKSTFLAHTSHEIRTPMSAILGYADLLAESFQGEGGCNPLRAEGVEAIRQHGHHMLSLVNDVLDLSRIEAGVQEFDRVVFSPSELLRGVADSLRLDARRSGTQLDVDVRPDAPQGVLGDPTRIRQVVLNLVGNALKFTEGGSVTVGLQGKTPNGGAGLTITVEDTGIGMDAEAQRRVFEPFQQATASTGQVFGGTGLGLTITRQLVVSMGGAISVHSVPREGTKFTVSLPVESVRLSTGVSTPEPGGPSLLPNVGRLEAVGGEPFPLDGKHVLVVDDVRSNRRLVQIVLERAGATVSMAEDGLGAVARWQDSMIPIDLVFMDVHMPGMDGTSALRELRTRGADMPIVALTADAMEGAEARFLAAGFDGYASKPISRDRIVALASSLVLSGDSERVAGDERAVPG